MHQYKTSENTFIKKCSSLELELLGQENIMFEWLPQCQRQKVPYQLNCLNRPVGGQRCHQTLPLIGLRRGLPLLPALLRLGPEQLDVHYAFQRNSHLAIRLFYELLPWWQSSG